MNIDELTKPENILHISLNIDKSIFENIFSKMEFLGAYEYILGAFKRHNIQTINISMNDIRYFSNEYGHEKNLRRKRNMAPASPQHEEFMKQFTEITERFEPTLKYKTDKIDILTEPEILKAITSSKKNIVMISGFTTDVEILITANILYHSGFIPVVISDATSTYSERMFFTALEFISMSGEVIDSRDLIKIWEY